MKFFRSRSNNVINEYRAMFGVLSIEHQMQKKRKVKFLQKKYRPILRELCTLFVREDISELTSLSN